MKKNIPKNILLLLTLVLFQGCQKVFDENKLNEFFIKSDIRDYNIKTVALLPMANDDTTSTGTFYSTNHFYNYLLEIPSIKVIDIDKIISSDSAAIQLQLNELVKTKRLNLDTLRNSDLGKFIYANNCDAIIIGYINFFKKYYYTWPNSYLQYFITTVTVCNFSYYMASLNDGEILWASNITGEATYLDVLVSSYPNYPMLDVAVSNGIDLLSKKLSAESVFGNN